MIFGVSATSAALSDSGVASSTSCWASALVRLFRVNSFALRCSALRLLDNREDSDLAFQPWSGALALNLFPLLVVLLLGPPLACAIVIPTDNWHVR
jgi:hypothetical protein